MKIKPILILPSLPDRISRLQDLAHNVWYSWSPDLVALFKRLDQDCWAQCNQNPVQMLAMISQEKLRAAAEDESFVAHLNRVYEAFNNYMAQKKWFETRYPVCKDSTIAYFSCEFGLDVSLPIYSGGLGVLSGDHLKTASDLGLPLVAVGLLYRFGYFNQTLSADGWQFESYTENDWYNMPVSLETDKDGKPITITVEIGDAPVKAQIWRVQVGRIQLYLLDCNLPENPSAHREITYQLYSGDKDTRIRQEILLGIGGVRALEALGYEPSVYHLNEGHSMFLCLERINGLMNKHGLSFNEAVELVWSTNVFTTHTPVPAGHENFDEKLVEKYLTPMAKSLGLTFKDLMQLGRNGGDTKSPFSMTIGALKLSAYCNGVSKLHGQISRAMWRHVFKGFTEEEVPITHVTNGVHTYSWISPRMHELFNTYMGPRFIEQPEDSTCWDNIMRIPDSELWRAHNHNKRRLVFMTREKLYKQLEIKGKSQQELKRTEEILDPQALTVGFARRFAAYKRGYLLFSDLERLKRIISNSERPIQFVFAGKAHPKDNNGKEIIKSIMHIAQSEEFRNNIVFLENYDLDLAYKLVAGVDVWLNTPRRPEEASGTSGMKAALNGALNLSILDGWWDEGYNPDVGWAIRGASHYNDPGEQDYIESQAVYDALERDILSVFYDCNRDEISEEWVRMMKHSIIMGGKEFSSHRMVREYTEKFYIPGIQSYDSLTKDNYNLTRDISAWNHHVKNVWNKVSVSSIDFPETDGSARVGQTIPVKIDVFLGDLTPQDVRVEIVRGRLNVRDEIENSENFTATLENSREDGSHTYHVDMVCTKSGRLGVTARILPNNERHMIKEHPRLVAWLN